MENMMKIRDVSDKYDITARTLRYYEDMGLICSVRSDDYAYRLYDETAIKRLEQILVLRKLNLSIKDIQRIFTTPNSDVVLEVLGKKVQSIDDEVALLHELKEIVLDFIHEIERMDFGDNSNVKLLYDKAKEIETHIINVEYIGKPSNVSRLLEVTEKLDKPFDIRVIRLLPMEMIKSPVGNPEENTGALQNFHAWALEKLYSDDESQYSGGLPIFSWNTPQGFQFIVKKPEVFINDMNWEEYSFPGGLYAVFSAWIDEIFSKFDQLTKWLADSPFFVCDDKAETEGRYGMSHIVTPKEIMELTKAEQHDVFVPIRLRRE